MSEEAIEAEVIEAEERDNARPYIPPPEFGAEEHRVAWLFDVFPRQHGEEWLPYLTGIWQALALLTKQAMPTNTVNDKAKK